jgi:KDO2-lipid IV(A) lauroyltransferase
VKINLSSFLQWKINLFLYQRLGWRFAYHYINLLGTLYFFIKRGETRIIKKAVESVFGHQKSDAEIKSLKRRVFRGILSHYQEKLFVAYEEPEKATNFLNRNVISEDLGVLHKKRQKGNGVILVTGHYGAIEYIPTLLAINDFPTSMIAKFKTRQLKEKIYSQAEKYRINMIDAQSSRNVVLSAVKELRENRILITQCDEIEEWRPSLKNRVSFLGRTTFLDRTINTLAKRTGAEIVFGVLHRYSLCKYKLILYNYADMVKYLNERSTSSIGETILKILEVHIYANPDQWYQWKQYLKIETALPDRRAQELTSTFALNPVFDKAS